MMLYLCNRKFLFNNHRWRIKVIWPRIDEIMKGKIKRKWKNIHIPYSTIEPKGQCDLQGPMIFLIFKLYGFSRSLRPICDSIQRIIREISAIESLMTSCLLDRKWHKKCFLRNRSHRHSDFTQTNLISIRK